jgi:hypothetical protein
MLHARECNIYYFSDINKNMTSNNSNFDIEKFDATGNAYMISGIQVQSGAPTNGQILVYSAATNQWTYLTPPALFAGIPVQTGTPTDGQTLKYDQASNEWKFSN